MKFRLALFLVFTLAACSAPGVDEAGPLPPANYKEIIKADILTHFRDPDTLKDVAISEPHTGRVNFVPGWRVCLRVNGKNRSGGYTGPMDYAYFFVNGQLQIGATDATPCTGYAYTAWPEMDGAQSKMADEILHPRWEYQTIYDALRQTDSSYASHISQNYYDLKPSDKDQVHAYLGIEKTASGVEVSLRLDHGQIECAKDGCDISLRFDGASMETIAFAHTDPADKSIVVATDSNRLLDQLKASHTLLIELDIARNGKRQFTFIISGLDMAKLP